MVEDAAKTGKKKKRILRWGGVFGESSRMLKVMVFVVLMVACAAMTFTQLGFIGVPLSDGDVAYVVTLLSVVALGALLLGTLPGALLGVVCGGVLLLHSKYMPLDHFELTYISIHTSVVMLGICGLLFGILFAFALRNDPSQVKRIVYIAIVSVIMSILYTLGFFTNAILGALASQAAAQTPQESLEAMAYSMVLQFGNGTLQMVFTAISTAVLCWVGDYAARKALLRKDSPGLRFVFGAWLGVVVALAFMVTAAYSFAAATQDGLNDAENNMTSETNYLVGQFKEFGNRSGVLMDFISSSGIDLSDVDEDTLYNITNALMEDDILDGYTLENDGTIIVKSDDWISASNDDRYKADTPTNEALEPGMIDAIDRSVATGRIQRFVYLGVTGWADFDGNTDNLDINPEIAYLYALPFTVDFGGGFVVDRTVVIIQPSSLVFANRTPIMVWSTVSTLVLMAAMFFIVFQLLNRMVARRIDEENTALAHITAGELETRAKAGGTREFESLSEGINTTVDALKGWIAEAESRMDAELATARAIQEAALPRIFPPYPSILKFDIYASMNPARQVGGDFYDFFLVGDDCNERTGKLGFVVADVSGKGVPAALFMMKAKALVRDYVTSGMELGEAVTEANRQLVDGNDANMFVTAWVGILDYETGHVDYVNAGHNPPLLWQRDGGWRWMREKSGPVLGLFETSYLARSVDCIAGDMFLLYTDGVTEAFNANEELYGEDRLLAVVEDGYRLHARNLLESVRNDVAAYAQGAEQSDDITLLTLEVGVPPEVTAVLEVPAELSQLDAVNEFLHAELDNRFCPQRVQNQLDIAVEEVFVNVCRYAYADAAPEVPRIARIQRTYTADPSSIRVDIIDSGVPFDPLAKPDAVTPDDIMQVPIGGLGILMAKKSSDEMRYERDGDNNVLTIVKKW